MEVGDSQLPTAEPSRGTLLGGAGPPGLAYGAVTLYGGAFQPTSATRGRPAGARGPSRRANNPSSLRGYPAEDWFGLSPFRSPLLRGSLLVSFPPPTKMFPFGGFPLGTPAENPRFPERHGLFARGGRPHSGIPGSTAACAYPGHIAACRALRRRPSRAIHRAASVPWEPAQGGVQGPVWPGPPGPCAPPTGPVWAPEPRDNGGSRGGPFGPLQPQEVIQPQVPLRLPCYDFSPLAGERFDPALARDGASPLPRSGGATGGVCKEQGRIHRAMLTRGY